MKLGVDGVQVGHWTDSLHQTGCTVVLFPEGTIGSGEVRGGAPATREFALLDPTKMMQRLDAAVLTGGSAFGLASADGVVDFCAEHDRGFVTSAANIREWELEFAANDWLKLPPCVAPRISKNGAICVPRAFA